MTIRILLFFTTTGFLHKHIIKLECACALSSMSKQYLTSLNLRNIRKKNPVTCIWKQQIIRHYSQMQSVNGVLYVVKALVESLDSVP